VVAPNPLAVVVESEPVVVENPLMSALVDACVPVAELEDRAEMLADTLLRAPPWAPPTLGPNCPVAAAACAFVNVGGPGSTQQDTMHPNAAIMATRSRRMRRTRAIAAPDGLPNCHSDGQRFEALNASYFSMSARYSIFPSTFPPTPLG